MKWNELYFKTSILHFKAILGQGQPGFMRWICWESCPWCRIARWTCWPVVQHAAIVLRTSKQNIWNAVIMFNLEIKAKLLFIYHYNDTIDISQYNTWTKLLFTYISLQHHYKIYHYNGTINISLQQLYKYITTTAL